MLFVKLISFIVVYQVVVWIDTVTSHDLLEYGNKDIVLAFDLHL